MAQIERIRARFEARSRALWAVVQQHERMEREEEEGARRSLGTRASEARRLQVREARHAAREAELEVAENARASATEAMSVLTAEQRGRLGLPDGK